MSVVITTERATLMNRPSDNTIALLCPWCGEYALNYWWDEIGRGWVNCSDNNCEYSATAN